MRTRAMLATLAFVSACATSTRARLPDADPQAYVGRTCVQQCQNQSVFEKPSDRDDAMQRCLKRCPGVVVEEGRCRPLDRQAGYCWERENDDHVGKAAMQGLAAGALVLLLLVVYGVAKVGD